MIPLTPEQQQLVRRHMNLVGWACEKWRRCIPFGEYRDATQDCYLALVTAAVRYRPGRAGFVTYAAGCIRSTLMGYRLECGRRGFTGLKTHGTGGRERVDALAVSSLSDPLPFGAGSRADVLPARPERDPVPEGAVTPAVGVHLHKTRGWVAVAGDGTGGRLYLGLYGFDEFGGIDAACEAASLAATTFRRLRRAYPDRPPADLVADLAERGLLPAALAAA